MTVFYNSSVTSHEDMLLLHILWGCDIFGVGPTFAAPMYALF